MDVNDDILGLFLERVDSHISLIRAAAVCRRWRRAVADAAFLRRYRTLHAPPVAGYYGHEAGGPLVMAPVFSPSSPPVVDARHLSLDFLPGGACSWTIQDSRGSLLLLREGSYTHFPYKISGMVVCEPMSRRYIRIHQWRSQRRGGRGSSPGYRSKSHEAPLSPPTIFGANYEGCGAGGGRSTERAPLGARSWLRHWIHPPTDLDDHCYCWAFYLIDGEPDETGGRINMSNFRVLCMFDKHGAMYTVGSSWSKKNIDHIAPSFHSLHPMGRGGGCWYFIQSRVMVVLDGSTGDFSSCELPPFVEDWDSHLAHHDFFITNGRDGKLCIFIVFDGTMNLFVRLEGGEWALEKRVLLSEATHGLPGCKPSYFSGPQYVFGVGAGYAILLPCIEQLIFSINLETMEVAPVVHTSTVYWCELPWPPTFQACLDG